MKKIILLLSLLFCFFGLNASEVYDNEFGQMLSVDIPHISSFANSSGTAVADLKLDVLQNETTFTVKYNGLISTAYSESTMRDDINAVLENADVWVRVSSMTKNGTAGTITFNILTPNNSQPILFSTKNRKVFKLGRVPSSIEIDLSKRELSGVTDYDVDIYITSSDMCHGRTYTLRKINEDSYYDEQFMYYFVDDYPKGYVNSAGYPVLGDKYQVILNTFLPDGREIVSNMTEEFIREWPYFSLVEVDPGDKWLSNDGQDTVRRRYQLPNGGPFSENQIAKMDSLIAKETEWAFDTHTEWMQMTSFYDPVNREYVVDIYALSENPYSEVPGFWLSYHQGGGSYTSLSGDYPVEVNSYEIEGTQLNEPYVRGCVKLLGADKWVKYTLYCDGQYVRGYVYPAPDEDFVIFDDLTVEGTYTVKGWFHYPEIPMVGSYKYTKSPIEFYNITGDNLNGKCQVTVQGSQKDVVYKLYCNDTYITEKTGVLNSGHIVFDNLTTEGIYTVKALFGEFSGNMLGSYSWVSNIIVYNIQGEQKLGGGNLIRVMGAQPGVVYKLYRDGQFITEKPASKDSISITVFDGYSEYGVYTVKGHVPGRPEVNMKGSYTAAKLYVSSDKTTITNVKEPLTFTLVNSDVDKEYYLWREQEGLVIRLQTMQGTGASLTFNVVNGTGKYWVEEKGAGIISNKITIVVEWPYQSLIAVPDEWSDVNVGNDGSPTYRKFLNIDFHVPSVEERTKLESILQDFNNGKVSSWDNRLHISLVSEPTSQYIVFEISGSINMGVPIQSGHDFNVTSQPRKPIVQSGGWAIIPYDIGWYKDDSNPETNNIIVYGNQNLIDYQLYCNDQYLDTAPEYHDSVVIFRDLASEGLYKVKGIYMDMERFMSKGLSIGNADINNKRVNIVTHTYTSPIEKVSDVTYYDGIGRMVQNIMIDKSLQGKDVVKITKYDIGGRSDSVSYLPYAVWGNQGRLREDPINEQKAYYSSLSQYSDDADYAFSINKFENSISNKTISTTQPGKVYHNGQGKRTMYQYAHNSDNDSVMLFSLNETSYALGCGFYQKGALRRYTNTNEDGGVSISFKNNEGKLVLSRVIDDNKRRIDTYYVYDLLGRSCWVVSPEGVNRIKSQNVTTLSIDDAIAMQYCYMYKYDKFGNKTEQRLPGRGNDYFIYDMKDRLVMIQDAELRKNNNWVYTVYDGLGRETHKALVKCTMSHDLIQSKFYVASKLEKLQNSSEPKPFQGDSSTVVTLLSETRYGKPAGEEPDENPPFNYHLQNDIVLISASSANQGQGPWVVTGQTSALVKRKYTGIDLTATFLQTPTTEERKYYGLTELYNFLIYKNGKLYYSAPAMIGFAEEMSTELVNIINQIKAGTYPDIGSNEIPEYLTFRPVVGIVDQLMVDPRVQQFKTYEKIVVLDGNENSSPTYIEKAYYYNTDGRIIQIVEKNHLGGISTSSFQYDYRGNVLVQHEAHETSENMALDVLLKTFSYDSRGRLLVEETVLNNSQPAIVQYAYDDLGNLAAKIYGDQTTPIVDSTIYNIRGQVTDRKSTLFEMQLRYHNPYVPGSWAVYAGNISEWHWQHKDYDGSVGQKNIYAFTYDKLGRYYASSAYIDGTSSLFHESVRYDDNGNIKRLDRNTNRIPVDNLFYEYIGNQLTTLHEKGSATLADDVYLRGASETGTYQYDMNGNMINDSRKNLDIEYNFLNLTSRIKEGSLVRSNYSWLANRTKVSARQPEGDGYEYMGSLMYHYVNGQRTLESATFGSGRIIANNGTQTTYVPNYYITDHLGSIRVIWDGANVVGRNDYYPSGTPWNNANNMASNDRFKYNGKEDQSLFGIDYLDYGARMYDPKLGRWHGIDPKANSFCSFSPYNFSVNNPISYVDPDGRSPYYTLEGRYLGVDANGFTGNIYIATSEIYSKIVGDKVNTHDEIIKRGAAFMKSVILSREAESLIYTHVLSQMKEVDVEKLHKGKVSISTNLIQGGKVIGYNDPENYNRFGYTKTDEGKHKITVRENSNQSDLNHVELIQNSLGIHEYVGHGVKGYTGDELGGTHWRAYRDQMKHPTFNLLPDFYKNEVLNRTLEFMRVEDPAMYEQVTRKLN